MKINVTRLLAVLLAALLLNVAALAEADIIDPIKKIEALLASRK